MSKDTKLFTPSPRKLLFLVRKIKTTETDFPLLDKICLIGVFYCRIAYLSLPLIIQIVSV